MAPSNGEVPRMATTMPMIDVDGSPDLLRLVEELRAGGAPVVLRLAGRAVAVVSPPTASGATAASRYPWRSRTAEDLAAARSAAGTWREVDGDRLLAEIYAERDAGERTDVDL